MLLTESDIQKIQDAIEAGAGLDRELAEQCWPLIQMGSGDNMVRLPLPSPTPRQLSVSSTSCLDSWVAFHRRELHQ